MITDSYLYPNSYSPNTKSDVQLNKTRFAEGAMVAAVCDGKSGFGTNVISPDEAPFGYYSSGHYYVCRNGTWNSVGYCVPTSGHRDFAYIDYNTLQHFILPRANGNTKRVFVLYGGGSGKGDVESKGGYLKAMVNIADDTPLTIFVGGHGESRSTSGADHRGGGYGGGGRLSGGCGSGKRLGSSSGGMSFVTDYFGKDPMLGSFFSDYSGNIKCSYDHATLFVVAGGAGDISEKNDYSGGTGGAEVGGRGQEHKSDIKDTGNGGTQTGAGILKNSEYVGQGGKFFGGDVYYNHSGGNWCGGGGGNISKNGGGGHGGAGGKNKCGAGMSCVHGNGLGAGSGKAIFCWGTDESVGMLPGCNRATAFGSEFAEQIGCDADY